MPRQVPWKPIALLATTTTGYSRNQPNFGLLVFMRDFDDLGKPPRPGERLVR